MLRFAFSRAVAAALLLGFATFAAQAQKDDSRMLGGYDLWIGQQDLYNSRGERLTEFWQVIRQDRANYHRFGRGDAQDDWDPYFSDAENRAWLERALQGMTISDAAERRILSGNVRVRLELRGVGDRLTDVALAVYD